MGKHLDRVADGDIDDNDINVLCNTMRKHLYRVLGVDIEIGKPMLIYLLENQFCCEI